MDAVLAPAAPAAPPAGLPGVGEILSAGTRVARGNAGLLLGLWAACGLPRELLRLAATAATGVADNDALQKAFEAGDWSVMGPFCLVGALGLALGLLGYAAVLLVTVRAHQGRACALGAALLDAGERVVSVFLTMLLTAFAAMLGGLLLVLPGVYVLVRLSLAACASVVEGAGARASVARSWDLIGGRFWAVVGVLLACVGTAFAAALALFLGGRILEWIASPAGEPGDLAVRLALSAGQFLISAWVTACMTKLYLELAALKTPPTEAISGE